MAMMVSFTIRPSYSLETVRNVYKIRKFCGLQSWRSNASSIVATLKRVALDSRYKLYLMYRAAWYKAYVCSRFNAGIAGSNSAEGMDTCLLCLLLVV